MWSIPSGPGLGVGAGLCCPDWEVRGGPNAHVHHAQRWGNSASRTRHCGETCGGRPGCGGVWAVTTVK